MSTAGKRSRGPFPWRVHPIWRGVGCILLIVLPIIAFGLAEMLVANALADNPEIFNSLDIDVRGPDDLYVKIGFAAVLSVVLYLVFSILGSLIYSLAGGHRDAEIAERTKPQPFKH